MWELHRGLGSKRSRLLSRAKWTFWKSPLPLLPFRSPPLTRVRTRKTPLADDMRPCFFFIADAIEGYVCALESVRNATD